MDLQKTLIVGYGNADRQDDGVAWRILAGVARRLGRPGPESMEDDFEPEGDLPHLLFLLQLMPELAETLVQYDRVCFVDAHTGRVPVDLYMAPVSSEFQASPFTHHMTPETCLALCQTLYGKQPQAVLVSVRGYEFGFSHSMSAATQALAQDAVQKIETWIENGRE